MARVPTGLTVGAATGTNRMIRAWRGDRNQPTFALRGLQTMRSVWDLQFVFLPFGSLDPLPPQEQKPVGLGVPPVSLYLWGVGWCSVPCPPDSLLLFL